MALHTLSVKDYTEMKVMLVFKHIAQSVRMLPNPLKIVASNFIAIFWVKTMHDVIKNVRNLKVWE